MNQIHHSRRLVWAVLGCFVAVVWAGLAQAAVGRTEASYDVTQNGAAVYSIPINPTEGINGMTPHLSVNYVGPSTRSIFGVGFALGGISYITPCRKTIAQDVNAAPITLTSTDRYCLDGARLRSLGTGTYGATNTQYRTEIDQLVRVTSLASNNNIPGWFRVEMPNGLTYEYGNSTSSKLMSSALSGATPQFWAVSKITDPYGNSIVFTYDTDAAQQRFRPSVISYTERSGVGDYKIAFVYNVTTLLAPSYYFTPSLTGNAAHKEDKLLDRIELKQNNSVYRSFTFLYETGAGENSRLESIQECAFTPSQDCLPPTQIDWQSATAGHNALASTGRTLVHPARSLDINGDGIEDLAFASGGTWRYILGGASGFGSIVNTTVAATSASNSFPLEWNGDGFADLLISWSDGNWRVLKGSATGFVTTAVQAGPSPISSSTSTKVWTIADVNADGRDDLISVPLNTQLAVNVNLNSANGLGSMGQLFTDPYVHSLGNAPLVTQSGTSAVQRPDFNGDGRTDLLIYGCIWDPTEPPTQPCNVGYWFQILSQGTTFTNEGLLLGASFNIFVSYGDLNGDGLTDVVYPANGNLWRLGYGQGSGGFSNVAGPSSAAHATYQTLVGDYDGDGLDDLYVTKNSPFQWEIYRSTSTGLSSTPIAPSPAISGSGMGWRLLDFNGDSLLDMARYDSSTFLLSLATHKGVPGEHLLSATDGLGNAVTYTYLPMTNSTVYVKGTGAVFPEQDYRGGEPLVRTMQVSPGGGSSYTFTYKYLSGRIHLQGRTIRGSHNLADRNYEGFRFYLDEPTTGKRRAFIGGSQREVTDSRDGVFTVETYRHDFPFIGAQAGTTVKQSTAGNAKTIQSVVNAYNHHVLETAVGKERYLPFRWQVTTDQNEVGGVRNGDPITQIKETHTVNTWGNSTFVSIDVKDTDALSPETGQIYRTEVTSTYSENSTEWCLAQPLTRSDKRILPGGSISSTRNVLWEVDSAMCRVDHETLEPGAGVLLALKTSFDYDGCGNIEQVTTRPEGTTNQNRVTTIDYGTARCQRPMTLTNAEGHVTNVDYDWSLALPTSITDPNGLVTTLHYDGFSRRDHELRPNGTGVRFALTACTALNSWCGKNNSARVRVTRTERSNADGILRTDEQFLDGLGRERWKHNDSLESGPAIIETLYDALNRSTTRTKPYFAGGTVFSTSYLYDLIGRATSINSPIDESSPSGRTTGYSYEGRILEVTDPANKITTRLNTALGQLRSLTDPSPGGVTTYAYHPFGELESITDAAGNKTSWSVNPRGFVDGTSDPDSGNWTFEVNAFGETTKIRDAKTTSPAWTTQFTFDGLSRLKTRIEAEGTTTLTWGGAAHNTPTAKYIGRLKSVSSPGGYVENYLFDALARLTRLRTTIDGTDYDVNQAYDAATGLRDSLTYPTSTGAGRFKIGFTYSNMLLRSTYEFSGSTTYWQGNSTDAWGHYQDETFGNGIVTVSDFDQASGFMLSREGGVGGGTGRINSAIAWGDLRGNLTQRQDLKLIPTVTEVFLSGGVPSNDALGRIDSSTRNGTQNLDVALAANGNITTKDSLSFVYTGAQSGCTYYTHTQPRAVRKVGSTIYCYDANGNMVKRAGSTIAYASYNLPTSIAVGSNSSALYYGAFRNRYKQIAVSGGTTETTLYVAGGLFERVTRPSGTVEYRHYVPGGSRVAALHTRRSSGIDDTYYLHLDHLGSPELISKADGTEAIRLSFGAYGERRDGSDWLGAPSVADYTTIGSITRLGFTGHEHLDSVAMIHMNGRVYDPAIGRFLSRDPIISGAFSSQGPNGYTYVKNNPLTHIDPTGFVDDVKCKQREDGGFDCWEVPPSNPPAPGPEEPPVPPHEGSGSGSGGGRGATHDREGEKDRPEKCRLVLDVESDWALSLGGYVGYGGEITFGHDEGNFFVTARVGFGVGGGISWTPDGQIPGSTPRDRNRGGWVASVSGQAGGTALGIGGTSELGIFRNFNDEESGLFGDLTGLLGVGDSFGIRGAASFAGQVTHYSSRQNFYENSGTCRLE